MAKNIDVELKFYDNKTDVWKFLAVKWLKRSSEAKLKVSYIYASMHREAYKPEHLTKLVKSHTRDTSSLNGMKIMIMAGK